MLIIRSRRFSFTPWFQWAYHLGLGVLAVTLLYAIYLTCFVCRLSPTRVREGPLHVPSWDFRKIERGLLALQCAAKADPPLSFSLDVRAKNSRPDVLYTPSSPQMLLGLKGSMATRTAASGQELYLQWEGSPYERRTEMNGPPSPLLWSAEASNLRVTPFVFSETQDADAVFFNATWQDEESGQERTIPFLIETNSLSRASDNTSIECHEPWFESLRSARFWTKDLFLDLYGSNGSARFEEIKLGIETSEGMYVLRVKEGDYLVYQDDYWGVAPLQNAENRPLAQVVRKEEGRLYVQIWDKSGFMHKSFSISPISSKAPASKIESDFLTPRMRNSSEVSCLLGQRRVVLKPGDWWLKEEKRNWRNLKRVNEIDDYLAFKSKGEIFVVESIEKAQGRSVLKGRLFDATRQMVQSVSLPVAEGRTATVIKPTHMPTDTKKKAIESVKRAPTPLARKGEDTHPQDVGGEVNHEK